MWKWKHKCRAQSFSGNASIGASIIPKNLVTDVTVCPYYLMSNWYGHYQWVTLLRSARLIWNKVTETKRLTFQLSDWFSFLLRNLPGKCPAKNKNIDSSAYFCWGRSQPTTLILEWIHVFHKTICQFMRSLAITPTDSWRTCRLGEVPGQAQIQISPFNIKTVLTASWFHQAMTL